MPSLAGERFGRLVAIEKVLDGGKYSRWKCLCDCGQFTTVHRGNLTRGRTKSCGCFNRERAIETNTIHGHSAGGRISSEYTIYTSMIQRCTNPNSFAYPDYGGRGITICERWLESFSNFIADMGLRPSGFQIDRTDNNAGYNKDNCRWVPRLINANNKRNCIYLEHNGERMTIAEWARRVDVPEATIRNRVDAGWNADRALTEPPYTASKRCRIARSHKRNFTGERGICEQV